MASKVIYEAAFLHIPKTGGTYVLRGCDDELPVVHPLRYLGHMVVADVNIPDLNWTNPSRCTDVNYSETPVFACVRNPFSLLVSYYEMKKAMVVNKMRTTGLTSPNDVEGTGDFGQCLEVLAARDERTFARYGKSFMFCQLFKTSGELAVNYICRQETLVDDVKEFARIFSFNHRDGTPQNEGAYKKSYREYYNDETVAFVAAHWPRELQMFDYGLCGESGHPMIGRLVAEEDKAKWHYDFVDDVLTCEGNVI